MHAFGWSKGTVRATLAFVLVGVVALSGVGLVIGLAMTGFVTEALAVWGSLVALAASASGFYFGGGGSGGPQS